MLKYCINQINYFKIFKVWTLCSSEGAGISYEPYCGKSTSVQDLGLGQGPNTVLQLASNAKLVHGEGLMFDNLFTSFDLLTRLSEKGLAGTGTVRQNRLNRVNIIKKKDMEKKTVARGTSEAVFNEDQVLTCWKDNKPVYIASNKYGMEPFTTCTRFNRTERRTIIIPVPSCVHQYNLKMGGVDIMDNMVACYRIKFRNIEDIINISCIFLISRP